MRERREKDMGSPRAKNTEDISVVTVTSSVLENILGVSDRRVRGLADEGILVRAAKGRYKLMESLKNYILNLKISKSNDIQSKDPEVLNLDTEKAKHEVLKRQMSELKLHLMEGTVHKSEDVRAVMSDMLVTFRSRLMNHPVKTAPVLAGMHDPGQIQEYLEKEMQEALAELKEYDPKEFYDDSYIDIKGDEKNGGAQN